METERDRDRRTRGLEILRRRKKRRQTGRVEDNTQEQGEGEKEVLITGRRMEKRQSEEPLTLSSREK